MQLSTLGEIQIVITRKDAEGKVMNVAICAENRNNAIQNETAPDETVDQLLARLKGMLRAMVNEEVRKDEVAVKAEPKRKSTFAELKDELTSKLAIK